MNRNHGTDRSGDTDFAAAIGLGSEPESGPEPEPHPQSEPESADTRNSSRDLRTWILEINERLGIIEQGLGHVFRMVHEMHS